MKIRVKSFLYTLLIFVFSAPVALANGEGGSGGPIWGGRNPVTCNVEGACTFCDAVKVGANIVDFLVQLTLSLGVLMIVYGAILVAISGARQDWYSKGKNAMTWAVIGVTVALGSWVIINTVLHLLSGNPNFPWSQIVC